MQHCIVNGKFIIFHGISYIPSNNLLFHFLYYNIIFPNINKNVNRFYLSKQ